MTKIPLLLLCGILTPSTTTAWSVTPLPSTTRTRTFTTTSTTMICAAAADDDYDAWLDQLDPAAFDEDVPRGGFKTHDYERDWKADRSNVDEPEVDRLLAARLQARKQGDFDQADALRDELLQKHGVSVWDKERLWRSGCSASGSGMKWGRNNNNNNSNRRENNNNRRFEDNNRRDDRRGGGRRQSNFGPNGHDYSLAPDAGPLNSPLTLPQIHELIAERLQFKLNRNFRAADGVENELYQNGVFVHDGKKLWRADGQSFGRGRDGPKPGVEAGSRQDIMNGYYTMSKYSPPLVIDEGLDDEAAKEAAEALQARVQELVDERLDARANRAFDVADDIREELRSYYNVIIDDRRREWSVNGIFDGPPEMSPYSLPISSLKDNFSEDEFDEEDIKLKIQTLVEERFHCKMERDYTTADHIREDLQDIYNVQVDDRNRMWSIGGNFQPPPEPYRRLPNSPLPEGIDEERVNEMLLEREEARKKRAFTIADDILMTLMEDYRISVLDRERAWIVVENAMDQPSLSRAPSQDLGSYAQVGAGELSEKERQEIEKLINERSMYKSQRQFGKADRIRDELQQKYNVRLDDRNREWHLVTNAYAYEASGHQLPEDTIHFIREQINERATAKLNRDYERADAIRDSLMDEFGVSIDDRLKVWRVIVDTENRLADPFPDYATPEDIDDYDPNQDNAVSEEASEGDYDEFYVEDEEVEEETEDEEESFDEEEDDDDEQQEEENEEVDLESLKVVDLKEMLRSRGLPVSGKKAELIERLRGQ